MLLEDILNRTENFKKLKLQFPDLRLVEYNNELRLESRSINKYCNNYHLYLDDDIVYLGFSYSDPLTEEIIYPSIYQLSWNIGKAKCLSKIKLSNHLPYLIERLLREGYSQEIINKALEHINKNKIQISELESYLIDLNLEYELFEPGKNDNIGILYLNKTDLTINQLIKIKEILKVIDFKLETEYTYKYKITWSKY